MSLPYSSDQNPVFLDAVKQKNFSGPNGPIPADKVNYYENYNGGGRSLLWTISDQCNNQTCFDYIIAGCMEKGFNPALCISMNLSESGGSNQIRFAPPKAASDFGCLLAERNNVASGLQCLTDKFFNQYKGLDYNQLFLKFAGDNGLTSSSYSRIKEFYTLLSSGVGITNGACAK